MFRRSLLFATLSIAVLGVFALPASAQSSKDDEGWNRKYKTPPPSARIEVTVLKSFNGKPIENAAVIFHPIEGDKDKGVLEIKTNEDGKAIIDVIPIGDTVRLQVIANGYQTYGQDYKIDKAEMSMEVKMKRPGAQYSTYGSNSSSSGGSSNAGSSSGGSSSPGSGSSTDKPSDSGNSSSSGSGSSSSDSNSGSNSQQTPPASQPK
jgi:hypothetical protein